MASAGRDMIGREFGPYQITALLGAGGMGEVYRARDRKLGRDVAIKILPQEFTADPERRGRFAREARVLATLSHPHIGAIYGLEEVGDRSALVLELVEGPTLADRLSRDRFTLSDALSIGRQIAEALDAAHLKGIIHRDLKPANIVLEGSSGTAPGDSRVKVLDFGIAKTISPGDADSERPTSVTLDGTEDGRILGTPAYMSPEQARGQVVDKRTDIWAFGCVLFEMLTGRRAFEGHGVTDTMARILEREPDWAALPSDTPASVHALLQRCLRKDPRKRLRDIADARLEIDDGDPARAPSHDTGIHDGSSAPRRRRKRLAWVTAALVGGALLAVSSLALWQRRTAATVGESFEFEIGPAPGSLFPRPLADFAISPDGSHLTVVGLVESMPVLWVRRMGSSSDYRQLQGTQGAVHPFWSPDSRQIGFFAEGKLKTVGLTGDAPFEVGEATSGFYEGGGGTWNRDGIILFRSPAGPLQKVPATGGTPTVVTTLKRAETQHLWPWFLPDGQHFLFLALGAGPRQLHVGSLTSMDSTPLGAIRSNAVYAAGHILFVQGGLMVQPFDPRSRQLTGEPHPLNEQMADLAGHGVFSVSETGVLGYGATAAGRRVLLTWMDRAGKSLGTVDQGDYFNLGLSPDDGRVAASSMAPDGNIDIWVIDLAPGGDKIRVTSDQGGEHDPAWSPDGKHLAFNSNRKNRYSLYRRPSDGSGSDQLVAEAEPSAMMAPDWSPNSKFIIFNYRQDVWIQPLASTQKPSVYVQTPFEESNPAFSPDGRWIVYSSDRTGRPEIYVRPFPSKEPEHKISRDGGRFPRWRGDEIFFLALDGTLMSARFDAAKSSPGMTPQRLFQTGVTSANHNHPYDVARNGQRFLIPVSREAPGSRPITIVTNWTARLPK